MDEAVAKLIAHVPARTVTAITTVTETCPSNEKASAGDRVTDVMVPEEMTCVVGSAVSHDTAAEASPGSSSLKASLVDTPAASNAPQQTLFVEGEI